MYYTPFITLIVRFKYRANRNDAFFNKKFLKGSKIRISEHLAPSNIELLEKVQKYVGVWQSWTRNAKIVATISDKKHQIKDLTELDKLIEHYELTELLLFHLVLKILIVLVPTNQLALQCVYC